MTVIVLAGTGLPEGTRVEAVDTGTHFEGEYEGKKFSIPVEFGAILVEE